MIPTVAFATLALLARSVSAKTFPAGAKADYQINGAYTPPTGVEVVTRDPNDSPATGLYNICYVNGFQTQPDDSRWDGSGAILVDENDEPVVDIEWSDEYILDIRTSAQRATIAEIVGEDIALCASQGFDAVEIDNLDTFERFGTSHGFTITHAIALSTLYATQIHGLGMKIAQKNAAGYSSTLKSAVGFDFAVAEECVWRGECADYSVYGSNIIAIEYSDDWVASGSVPSMISAICATSGRPASTMLRDRNVEINTHVDHDNARC